MRVIDPSELLFNGVTERFAAGRYHSWNVRAENLPACLKITAVDSDGLVMAASHTQYDVRGVQFHPESVLTPQGKKMVQNWLEH